MSIKIIFHHVDIKSKHNIAQRFLWAIHHNDLDDARNQPVSAKIQNGIQLVNMSVLLQIFFALHANQLD